MRDWTERHLLASLTDEQKDAYAGLVGKVNRQRFRGHPPGTVFFQGCSGHGGGRRVIFFVEFYFGPVSCSGLHAGDFGELGIGTGSLYAC